MNINIFNTKQICACGNSMNPRDLACSDCYEDLAYHIAQRTMPGNIVHSMTGEITLEKFIEHVREEGVGPVGTCSICGGRYIWGGNNPFPVVTDENARCCYRCNDEVVIPARINMLIRQSKKSHKPTRNQ